MVLAIVKKELREARAFAALSLVLSLVYVSQLTGKGVRLFNGLMGDFLGLTMEPSEVPFVQDNFVFISLLIGVALAIALGFRQSAWEPSQGTALYLLHLPLPRRTLFLTKLITGIGLLLACSLLPILAYATWAAVPRTHPGPFEWSMTGPAFRIWLLLPLVYLGAFASGIRPARWFGSRLLPLGSVAIAAIFLYAVPHWWLIGVPLLVLVAAVLVADILGETERRDF
jgi:ABC-type transport system involved in multi-copper enzyme maturation permease subunit